MMSNFFDYITVDRFMLFLIAFFVADNNFFKAVFIFIAVAFLFLIVAKVIKERI